MALSKITWAERVRLVCIASIASAFAAVAIPATISTPVEAKTPGKTYCFVGKCHRVKTIAETQAMVGKEEAITASHYDDCSKDRFNPCGLTSSGEQFHPDRPDNTASPIYPDGTQLLVWSPENKRALVVRVNNAGPYWGNRTLDLSRAAAEKLGFEGDGVAKLKLKVIKAPEEHETKYVKNRNYDPVPGDIGQYASLDEAQQGMAVVLAFKATTGSPYAPVTTANAFKGQGIGSNMLVAEAPQAMGRSLTLAYSGEDVRHTPIVFGGFSTQSRIGAPSRSQEVAANQTEWDEDRVIDEPQPQVVAAMTETSSITEQAAAAPRQAAGEPRQAAEAREAPEAKKVPKARLAAAAYEDDAKPRKGKMKVVSDDDDTKSKKKVASNRDDGDIKGKKVARKSDDDEDTKAKKKVARNNDEDEDGRSERRRSRREVASYEERRSYSAERDYEYRSRFAQVERNYGSGGRSEGGRSAGQLMSDNLRPL
jgi:rare lipoprotein A (peptidoglycan hydrolase)